MGAREPRVKPSSPRRHKLSAKAIAGVRTDAAIYYITVQKPTSLEQMSRMPEFAVPLRTLEEWSKNDRWVERRNEFYRNITNETIKRIGTEVMKARRRDLEDLEVVRNKAIEHLTDPEVKPRSFEGVSKAMIDSISARDHLLTSIAADLPATDEDGVKSAADFGLDRQDLQEIAAAYLQARNAKLAASVSATGEEAPPAIPARTIDVGRTVDDRTTDEGEEEGDDDGDE